MWRTAPIAVAAATMPFATNGKAAEFSAVGRSGSWVLAASGAPLVSVFRAALGGTKDARSTIRRRGGKPGAFAARFHDRMLEPGRWRQLDPGMLDGAERRPDARRLTRRHGRTAQVLGAAPR